jgi:ribosomal protein S11
MTPEDLMKVVLFFLTVAGSGWAIWWKIDGKVTAARAEAASQAAAATALASLSREELGDFKLRVAETYVTKQGLQEQTGQIMRAIESVGNRIDSMSDRLDRAFESQSRRPSARS